MNDEYRVMYQDGFSKEENDRWYNAGWVMDCKRTFKTLEEALQCKDKLIEKYKTRNKTIVVNGIGITCESTSEIDKKLEIIDIKIEKRKVTPWERV